MKILSSTLNSENTNMLRVIIALVLTSFTALGHFQKNTYISNLKEADVVLNSINLKELGHKIYGQPKPEVGQLLKNLVNTKQNPEEIGTYFEGDILHPTLISRNGLRNQSFRWKNGVVPVDLRGEFNPKELKIINSALEIYHNNTCIKFIQHSNESDYITITNHQTGCWSSLGRVGGQQIVNLQSPMCLYKVGTPIHELMHVLGFNHEHTREDRDEYIEINWKNIPTETYVNFRKALNDSTISFGVEYDYESVLHYSPYAFAMDSSKPTIRPMKSTQPGRMGQRDGLSKSDVEKIWKMYKCINTTKLDLDLKKKNDFFSKF